VTEAQRMCPDDQWCEKHQVFGLHEDWPQRMPGQSVTVPPEAVTASAMPVALAIESGSGTAGDAYLRVARRVLEAAAPFIAAAERDRIIGYQADGKTYHPADVVIIRRDAP
jgi:hypothetical protein